MQGNHGSIATSAQGNHDQEDLTRREASRVDYKEITYMNRITVIRETQTLRKNARISLAIEPNTSARFGRKSEINENGNESKDVVPEANDENPFKLAKGVED